MLSVAIPSFGREQVLLDTLADLIELSADNWELLLIDQTPQHEPRVARQLQMWHDQDQVRWIRQYPASVTAAMNRALREARGTHVLFLDDDIRPDPLLLKSHQSSILRNPHDLIAGRVLQPWHSGQPDPVDSTFGFNSLEPCQTDQFIGCNFSIPRELAISIGGFDENFVHVAYCYEAEFSFRWLRAGFRILYTPDALIHHLKAERGGTRSYGQHLTTIQPSHAVGRYYFLLRTCTATVALISSIGAFARSVRSRHHLRRPWWIPLTLLAESRGFIWALCLHLHGPRLIPRQIPKLLIASSHPIQYQAPLFRNLAADPLLEMEVLFLTLPTPSQQGSGFGVSFHWDVPLLEGYRWRRASSIVGSGLGESFFGLRLKRPGLELRCLDGRLPDAVMITGWHVLGLLQLYLAAWRHRLPILLRVEAPALPRRRWPVRLLHRFLIQHASACLPIGEANARFFSLNSHPDISLFPSPYFVDNDFFFNRAAQLRHHRRELRQRWGIPPDSFCFVFVGKLQPKKNPLDLLEALRLVCVDPSTPLVHLLVVGSGELETVCREHTNRYQLPVSFAGFLNQTDIVGAYVAADAIVLPSDRGETWGLVVNEAMACGLPAIVSDQVGCAPDLVIMGVTGLVFPCNDVSALAQSLTALAVDPTDSSRMGSVACDRVHSLYGVEQAAAGVRHAVHSLTLEAS